MSTELTVELAEKLVDRSWRLNNLYYIKDKAGKKILFNLNWAQQDFLDNLHYFNVVLKARQLGFSTFILMYILDSCLFNTHHAAGVIAQGLNEAVDLFDNKVKFAYDNLPDWLKNDITLVGDNARQLEFNNGSKITIGTSLRGGTLQKLHVSEMGKIAARYPDKAKEIKTGAFNTIQSGQMIFVESTAEGAAGEFYELVMHAKRLQDAGKELGPMDPKLHFYPWYKSPDYVDHDETCVIPKELHKLFSKIPDLKPEQKTWYAKKALLMRDDMKREFPGTIEEAFERAIEGTYYTKEMEMVRKKGQITHIPYNPAYPVHTFWDLGVNDMTSIWFFQNIKGKYHFIEYYEAHTEGLGHYATYLDRTGYKFGKHYWPHDGGRKTIGENLVSPKEIAERLGIRPIRIVPKTNSVIQDINRGRMVLPLCFFDEKACAKGITYLDMYRREWDDKLAVWRDSPLHNDASHCADAFRTFVVGYKDEDDIASKREEFAEIEYDVFKY